MKPVPLAHRFSFRVIAGLISMLFLVGVPFFFLFLSYHRDQLLETMETSTTHLSQMLTRQLEILMLQGRHGELQRMVETLSSGTDARSVMILDPRGRVAVSSDPLQLGRVFQRNDEHGCRECHQDGGIRHTISLRDTEGRSYYRNVNVIRNSASCFPCHDSRDSVNGILIMDFSPQSLQSQFRASVTRLLWMGAIMLLLTIAVLYFLLSRLVIKKLKTFADATEQIGKGRFRRIQLPGNDEFSQLAASFNQMSGRLEAAMKETRESKEYLESVINNIDDEIVVVGRSFDIVTANAAYFLNRRVSRKLVPEEKCALWKGDGACAESLDACETCASALTFRDGRPHKVLQSYVDSEGKERFVEAYSSPLRNVGGEFEQVIEVRRDITERKLLEANLAHSERLVYMGLLASGLAHEINNPLASISTFVDGLKRRLNGSGERPAFDQDRLDRSLSLIQREIERVKDVTHRLLILAQKKDSGLSLVDLNQSLLETISLIRYEASRRDIRIEVEEGDGIPVLKVPESQIRQVFLNLLLNSLQAGHSGGYVRCRTRRGDGGVLVSVEDDGCGIEAGDFNKIFDPFYSKKNPGHGTGLGLFICRSIVSSLGGHITVESRPGAGSRFTVYFPEHS